MNGSRTRIKYLSVIAATAVLLLVASATPNPGGSIGISELLTSQNESGNVKAAEVVDRTNTGWAYIWERLSERGIIKPTGAATDEDGNIYIQGLFSGGFDFSPGVPEAQVYQIGSSECSFLVKFTASSEFQWIKVLEFKVPRYHCSLVVSDNGEAFLAGSFSGEIDFDPGPDIEYRTSTNTGSRNDRCLCKFDSDGNFVWVSSWWSESYDLINAVTLDEDGQIYIAGMVGEVTEFTDPDGLSVVITSQGDDGVICFDRNGKVNWKSTWGDEESGRVDARDLAVDKEGLVYVVGEFVGEQQFGEYSIVSNGFDDSYLVRLNQNGEIDWVKTWGGIYDDSAKFITLKNNDSVLVAGTYDTDTDFDPGPEEFVFQAVGDDDIYITRFSSDGDFVMGICWGGHDFDRVSFLATDNFGNIFVAGTSKGLTDFALGDDELVSYGNRFMDAFVSKFNPDLELLWTDVWAGSSNEKPGGFAVDSEGHAYVAFDHTGGTVDLDPGVGVEELTHDYEDWFGILIKVLPNGAWEEDGIPELLAQGPIVLPERDYSGFSNTQFVSSILFQSGNFSTETAPVLIGSESDPSPSGWVEILGDGAGMDIQVDPQGNIYVLIGSSISKWSPDQNLLWVRSSQGLSSSDIRTDLSGNTYFAGYGSAGDDYKNKLIRIEKISTAGDYEWAYAFGGSGSDVCYSSALAPSGGIYITGYFTDPTDFDPGTEVAELEPAGLHDGYVARFDSACNFLWARSWAGGVWVPGRCVVSDTDGNVVVAGTIMDEMTSELRESESLVPTYGSQVDIYVRKFSAIGDPLWGFILESDYDDRPYGILTDFSGNVYMTGYFQGTIDFDPDVQVVEKSAIDEDAFLAKYDPDGKLIWVRTWGTNKLQIGYDLAIGPSGDVYISGQFALTTDFDPGDGIEERSAESTLFGFPDAFVLRLSPDGEFRWVHTFGGISNDWASGVELDQWGNIYIIGSYDSAIRDGVGGIDFDPGPGEARFGAENDGNPDAYILKLLNDGTWQTHYGYPKSIEFTIIHHSNYYREPEF